MRPRPLYVDIDGTLTTTPGKSWGPVLEGRLDALRGRIARGEPVVLWSGNGTDYARAFADRHGLEVLAALGKPECCVDDNPTIRPPERMPVHAPGEFFRDEATT